MNNYLRHHPPLKVAVVRRRGPPYLLLGRVGVKKFKKGNRYGPSLKGTIKMSFCAQHDIKKRFDAIFRPEWHHTDKYKIYTRPAREERRSAVEHQTREQRVAGSSKGVVLLSARRVSDLSYKITMTYDDRHGRPGGGGIMTSAVF